MVFSITEMGAMVMIDLNDPDIMSSSEAAKRWHKADDYVRQMYRKTPEKFPEGSIRKFGKQLVVTRQGMEMVTGVTEAEAEENTARKQVS
ncbi:hypothetical protein FC98_GL001775 [Lentilactobacillus kisonensis DSM 19906 = JCM 15041]|uniref:Helix-turn-helix domain-containing protein n=3 Tax=Lentilactobacillus kisonensis TaxID=481722 RepID=H1LHB5_9LACO|nr:hypothetical protein HMPREF9104_02005 [Lentilactobacillus kisonensis F0435]KRL20272.1 hypothetical protein FC98_GL001775 [Lentilactobacillus kisonensis DSM 19906 = JCM 15041]